MHELIAACQEHARMHVALVTEDDLRRVGRECRAATERSVMLDNCQRAASFRKGLAPLCLRVRVIVLARASLGCDDSDSCADHDCGRLILLP